MAEKMKKFEGYLLVSDIDGTLADHRYIAKANIEAVNRFLSDGGKVVLATGRSPQSSVPIAKELGCSPVFIANNGALVYDCEKESAVLEYELGCTEVAFDIIKRFPSAGALFYCGTKLWLISTNKEMEELIESESLSVLDKCDDVINKVLFSGKAQLLDEIEAYCRSIDNLDGDVVRSDDVYIEILPYGVDKGKAMVDLAKDMGISPDRVFAAGNYYNDISMLKSAALSCAPIESPDDVKNEVDLITCSCREGAIAQFIDHLYTRF